MRTLRFALAAASLIATAAFASPADPKNGAEYLTLAQPQPVQAVGNKVEVIEFFMYHCPACNAVEPHFAQWIKKQGDNISVRRVHMPLSGPNDPEARLYVTLEAMGKVEQMHAKVFRGAHVERVRMNSEAAIIDWVSKNGIDKAKFLEAWNSFGVMTKMKRLGATLAAYRVDSTPSFVVDGRYLLTASSVAEANPDLPRADLFKNTTVALDALVAKVQKDKGFKPAAAAAPAKPAAPAKAAK
ncbi:thiol:disulfide interchange protein DsbA/DsbL [Massilia glaciei]|uniref:Thiol:disulfide interchange protein DsbA n=1 Tax=Massilia glaciei TaxID=1524097 RepID=A0A2U2I4M3_9BURK|nr:thiol:disulfide interchange protein DsbA/DsbL [Massilia glaciei]